MQRRESPLGTEGREKMAEYIEKQAAKEKLCGMCRWEGTSNCDDCEHPIDDIPPADVRPVVMCGECRWFDVTCFPNKDLYMPELRMGYCRSLGRDVQACWFCGTGEQKEDANSLMEAIERNTTKIVEKSNELLAEYIRHLQEKNKALDEELASLREAFLQATRGGRVDADEKD